MTTCINENRRRLTLLLTIAPMLLTVGCRQVVEPGVQSTQKTPANDAYIRGRELLFNAPTRFEYPKAISLLEEAVKQEPDNPSARVALVYAYTKRGKYSEAAPHLASAQASRADLPEKEALWLDAVDAAVADDGTRQIQAWTRVVESYPADRWAWYELASSRLAQEDFDGTVEAVVRALEIEPDSAKWEASWIYYLHSKALFRGGKPKLAVTAAEPGRENATTWRSTYYRMALGSVASGQLSADNFVDRYREISDSENRNSEAMTETNIALFFFELGDYARAIEHAQGALELSPGAYQSWALGYSLIESGTPEVALPILENALSAKPDDVYLLAAKGWALYRLARYDQAHAALLAAQSAAPRRVLRVEQDLSVVRKALNDPDAPQALRIPWLG